MALVHPSSCECAKSELDLFSVPDTQTSIDRSQYVEYRPLSSVTDGLGPIDFTVYGTGEEYVDLSETFVHVTVQIRKPDGTAITPQDMSIGPVNYLINSMFSQIEVSLNEKLVTSSNNTYAYRSYLETLLSFGSDAKKSQLTSSLWSKDTSGYLDSVSGNLGFQSRRAEFNENGIVEMYGRPHLDLSFQDRLILNGVDLKFKFVRSKDEFCLMGAGKLVVKDISLFVRKVKPSAGVQLGHIKALERTTAKYPIRRIETKTFTAPRGNLSINQENLFLGQLPTRIILGCVETGAYNGSFDKNPFNFRHFDLDYLSLFVDGIQVPSKAYKPDFANGNFLRCYMSLFDAIGITNKDEGNDITRQEYKDGFSLFGFDLSPDLSNGGHFHLVKSGTLRLEIHFKNPLPTTVNVIAYAEFENVIEIDKARNVMFDFSL